MDGDGQHLLEDVINLYTVYKMLGDFEMVIGNRGHIKEVWYRWGFRKLLNFLASCIANHYLIDLNSGMRIFNKKTAIGYFNILCDTFSFTTSLTMSMIADNLKVTWFPIHVQQRSFGKSHVKCIRDGLITLFYILWIGFAMRTRGIRKWLRSFQRFGSR